MVSRICYRADGILLILLLLLGMPMCSSANYSYFVGLAAMDTDKSPVEEVLIFGIEVFS